MSRHKWSKEDHIIALYLYKYGVESLGDILKLSQLIDISVSSILMKFANLTSAIYGEDIGKFKAGEMDREVVEEYKNKPQEDFRKEAFDILYKKFL